MSWTSVGGALPHLPLHIRINLLRDLVRPDRAEVTWRECIALRSVDHRFGVFRSRQGRGACSQIWWSDAKSLSERPTAIAGPATARKTAATPIAYFIHSCSDDTGLFLVVAEGTTEWC